MLSGWKESPDSADVAAIAEEALMQGRGLPRDAGGKFDELDNVDELVRNHRMSVFRFAMARVGDYDLAETVTQECLMRAIRFREGFRGSSSVRTWLYAIAANLIRDYTRTKRARFYRELSGTAIHLSEADDYIAHSMPSPERNLLAREQVERFWRAVAALPERQRKVLRMRFEDEMTLVEMAAATGMTLSAIKTELYRGLRRARPYANEEKASANADAGVVASSVRVRNAMPRAVQELATA